ncbi:Alpha-1A adrenergic receptor [Desmophyllum pertusum]|uniref:Alpha-1A adrenergic receptor n=1 Tax=Desmophyllum pertusum TaxID=174260 RepID=A0A9W9Y901_9CNID|nr:Alpha-1A adrenergic receptor [Desmophyllum pertusum]
MLESNGMPHQKVKRQTRPQVVEHSEQDTSAKTRDVQLVHITVDNLSLHQNLEDGNGLQKRKVCETQTQEEKSDVIRQPSPDKICTEDACGVKSGRPSRVEYLTHNPGRKTKVHNVSAKPEIKIDEQALAKGRATWVKSGKEHFGLKYIPQDASQDDHGSSSDKPRIIESLPKSDSLQPTENHTRKPRRPPGKIQMRLTKLLKEGKAARDVMVIIGAFVICYLPLCIMRAIYQSIGGVPSPETIISIHFVYTLSMVCNPIIYSIRKEEFRKALRKRKHLLVEFKYQPLERNGLTCGPLASNGKRVKTQEFSSCSWVFRIKTRKDKHAWNMAGTNILGMDNTSQRRKLVAVTKIIEHKVHSGRHTRTSRRWSWCKTNSQNVL